MNKSRTKITGGGHHDQWLPRNFKRIPLWFLDFSLSSNQLIILMKLRKYHKSTISKLTDIGKGN